MGRKILIVFLFTLITPTHFIFAELQPAGFGTPIGTPSNPIYIQIQPDTYQLYLNARNKINSIQYVSACAQKYNTIRSYVSNTLDDDIGNPAVQTSNTNYFNYLYSSYQLCINHAAQTQSQSGTLCNGKYYSACPSGENFVCPSSGNAYCEKPKTNDQICQASFGPNSNWDGTKNSEGKLNCGCKVGYVSSTQGTSCVLAPTKTNSQICQDNYGLNSNWDGTKNSEGGLNCSCNTGYRWNQGQTLCILIPQKEVKPSVPMIKKDVEIKNTQEKMQGNILGSVSSSSDNNVITPTEIPKQKGFWARLLEWLGF